MKLHSVTTFVLTAALAYTASGTDPFCGCQTCCHVDNETDFAGSLLQRFTYEDVSYTGEYTVLGETLEPYQVVMRYENSLNPRFDQNVRIFQWDSALSDLNCDESHVYWKRVNVTEDGTVHADFKKLNLTKFTDQSVDYCAIDAHAVLERAEIEDTDQIYFAFNRLVNEKTDYAIMYDQSQDARMVPIDDLVDYQYQLDTVTLLDKFEYDQFFIEATVLVKDVNDDAVDPSCMDIDTVVAAGKWYIDGGAGDCDLTPIYGIDPTGDETVEGRTYKFMLNQSEYETCTMRTEVRGTDLVFHARMYFEEGAAGDDCFYFQPGRSAQNISITVDADVTDTIDGTEYANFNTEIVSVTPDNSDCPVSTYVQPHAKVSIAINATFPSSLGYTGYTIDLTGATVPYLTDVSGQTDNRLLWDSATGLERSVCAVYNEGTETEYTECTFYFISELCEPVYDTEQGTCAFDTTSSRFVENLVIREQLQGGLYIEHHSPSIDTNLEFQEFDTALCEYPEEKPVVDVTDTFEPTLYVRNWFQEYPGVDWYTNTTALTFDQELILRMGVAEQAQASLQDISLHIKTVKVTIQNPNPPYSTITQYSFNVNDKKRFMGTAWSTYYTDPKHCSWYDEDHVTERCRPFFDETDGRWNPWHTANFDATEVSRVCQLTDTHTPGDVDTRNTDFWSFDPAEWFPDQTNAFIRVKFDVTGVIHKCGPAEAGRRLSADVPAHQDPTNSILFVTDEFIYVFNSGPDGTSQEFVERDETTLEDIMDDYPVLFAVVCVVIGLASCACLSCIVGALCRRHRKKRDGFSQLNNLEDTIEKGVSKSLRAFNSTFSG